MIDSLRRQFLRELEGLRTQVDAFPEDDALWVRPPGVTNPVGVLVRHLCGNLRHFVGAQLGGTGFVRDRDEEFEGAPCSRTQLRELIEETRRALEESFARIEETDLSNPFPIAVAGIPMTTGTFLHHLLGHLAYHLGQIDALRRVTTGQAGSLRLLAIPALAPRTP